MPGRPDRPDPREVLGRPAPPPDALLRYGPADEHVADLRLPRTGRAGPLVVVVHGGFWQAEWDRAHTGPMAAALAAAGHPVAAVEYRRVGQPGGGWPGTFDDVLAALDRLPDLAAAAGAAVSGPSVLVGHSAGGHLAVWAAHQRPAMVRAVVSLAGVLDLVTASRDRLGDGAADTLLDGSPERWPGRYAAASPRALVPPPVPVHLVHGRDDRQVPVAMSRDYAAAAGGAVTLTVLDGVEHFGLIDPLSPAWPAVARAVSTAVATARVVSPPHPGRDSAP